MRTPGGTVRILALSVSLAMLTACINGNWSHVGDLAGGCEEGTEFEYFYDADLDGWGEPFRVIGINIEPATSVEACTAAEAAAEMAVLLGEDEVAVAANNRDCVDDILLDERAENITGRIGSICPDQLVTNPGETYFTPLSAAGVEIVIVHDEPVDQTAEPTPVTWGDAAADACGPWGWGGGVLSDTDEATGSLLSLVGEPVAIKAALNKQLPSEISTYAGFVGVVSQDLVPPVDGDPVADGWYWESIDENGAAAYTSVEDAALFAAMPFCPAGEPNSLEYTRLAAIYDENDSNFDWCLGLPSDASERYDTRFGHFICQRPIPEGSDYSGRSDYGL